MDLVKKLSFDDARKQLNDAAEKASTTGCAGLTTDEVSNLFLSRAMAVARADWKPERSVDEATRVRAYEDYVRAATVTPEPGAAPQRLSAAGDRGLGQGGRRDQATPARDVDRSAARRSRW